MRFATLRKNVMLPARERILTLKCYTTADIEYRAWTQDRKLRRSKACANLSIVAFKAATVSRPSIVRPATGQVVYHRSRIVMTCRTSKGSRQSSHHRTRR